MKIGFPALMAAGIFYLGVQSAFAQSTAPAAVPPSTEKGIVVEPTPERPKPPDGDPRSNQQRREDRMAFGKCMLSMQGRTGESFSNPSDPLSYCQQRLGMANANDVPAQTRAKQP